MRSCRCSLTICFPLVAHTYTSSSPNPSCFRLFVFARKKIISVCFCYRIKSQTTLIYLAENLPHTPSRLKNDEKQQRELIMHEWIEFAWLNEIYGNETKRGKKFMNFWARYEAIAIELLTPHFDEFKLSAFHIISFLEVDKHEIDSPLRPHQTMLLS